MASNGDKVAEKALNHLEEFHKKQKEMEWDRRKKRNAEVDELISQLGDPKVAEKLRIYRLVEEQFNFIESEIEKQVKSELEAKKRKSPSKPKTITVTKNPGNVLVRARKMRMELAKELQNEDPPAPIKDNLAQVRAERQAQAKERLLRPRGPRHVPKHDAVIQVQKAPKIGSIPSKKVVRKNDDKIVMLAKPVIKNMTDAERQKMMHQPENVGFVSYEYSEAEQESKILSAHLLGGIDIVPCGAPIKITDNVKVFHALMDQDVKPKQIESAVQTSFDFEKPVQDNLSGSGDVKVEELEDEYSDNFEDDDDHDQDLLKEFAPKIAAMQEFTDDSLTDRLSTIPEIPSQATSVEEFHKVLEQSSRSSSASPSKSSSLITSPIHVPQKSDKEVSEEPREIPSPMENQRQLSIIQQTKDEAFKETFELSEGLLEPESPILDDDKVKNDLSEGPLDESSPMLDQRQVSKIDIPNENIDELDKSQLSEGPLEESSPKLDQRQVSKIDILEEDSSSPILDQKQLSRIELSEGPLNSEDSLERLSLSDAPILDQSVSVMQGNADKNSSSSLMASSSASLTTCSSLSKSEHLSEGQIVMSVELSEGELKASSDSLDD